MNWIINTGVPKICQALPKIAEKFGSDVVPKLLEYGEKFVNWFFDTGIPKILDGLGRLGSKIIEYLPTILSALGKLTGDILLLILKLTGDILLAVGKLGLDILGKIPGFVAQIVSFLWNGITSGLQQLGSWIMSFLSGILSRAIDSILPSGMAGAVKGLIGVHHGGLYMSPDEHMAVIQEGETVLPRGKSERLDAMLEGRSYWQQRDRDKAMRVQPLKLAQTTSKEGTASVQDNSTSINIDKVDIIVKADKLSVSDARKQAQFILNEFRKLNKEEKLRSTTKRKNPVMA